MTRPRDQPPEHWTATRLRHVLRLNPSKSELSGLEPADEVSFLPMEAIGEQGTIDLSTTRPVAEVQSGYSYFRDGDVVIAKITPCFENGKGALMRGLHGGAGFGTTELIVARPAHGRLAAEYLQWLFQSREFRGFGEGAMYGAGGQKRIPDDFVRDFRIALPPFPEQAAIAAFLDRETAKIDALVEEQKRLIDLLKEKRQAVISHAVTKGLNPDAPMKDTGIEWLGQVPEHWEVKRLKWVVPQITVGIVVEPSKYYVESGVPALRSLNVRPGHIRSDGLVYISEGDNELLSKSKIQAGDIVAVRSGQPGTAAVVPTEFDGANCIDLIIIRKPTTGSEWYLCWFLASDTALRQFGEGSGGAIQQHFNIGTAMNLMVAVPPPNEQHEIATWLKDATTRLDLLLGQALEGIELLHERRSALISAAVTGKIDIRGMSEETEVAA